MQLRFGRVMRLKKAQTEQIYQIDEQVGLENHILPLKLSFSKRIKNNK